MKRKKRKTKAKLREEIERLERRGAELEGSKVGAEQEARENYALMQGLIEGMPDPVFLKDRDSRYRLLNTGMARALGQESVDEVVGRDDTEFMPLDLARRLQENDRETMESGESIEFEETVQTVKGLRLFRTMKTPYRDETGAVVGVIGVARDITERKKAEEERDAAYQQLQATEQQLRAANEQLTASEQQLRASNQQLQASNQQLQASEQQLRASNQQLAASNQQLRATEQQLKAERDRAQSYLEVANVIFVVIDADETVSLINRKGCEILGYERDEILGRNWFDTFLPPRLRDHVRAVFDRLMAGDVESPESYENPVVTKEGGERIVAWRNTTLTDDAGNPTGTLGSGQDITEQKRAEEALRRSEQRYALAERAAQIGSWEWDVRMGRGTWSPAMERIAGLEPGGFGGTFDDLKAHVAPDDLERTKAAFDACARGEGGYDVEYRLIRADGSVRWVRDVGQLVSQGEKPSRVVGVCMDITERRQLEEQLRQSQKLEAVGRLAGGVAHDFNNILTGITGYAEFLVDEFEPGSRPAEDLAEIQDLAAQAAALTRQLLAFSRRQTIEPVVLDINHVLQDTTKMLRRLIGEDIELELHLAPDLGTVHADPGQVEQILMNLVVNARDAMPSGGTLTIETANTELDQAYADRHAGVSPGPYVLLAVTDTGQGMDEDTLGQVFEPFFTTKAEGKGTGLGLATVYGIVKQHGGNIWAYSEPGKGSTFKVYLPRAAEGEEAVGRGERAAPRAAGTETILVVEDEEPVRKLTVRILEGRGYTVHAAADAEEAGRMLEQVGDRIDLLLSDVVLPGTSGRELYEAHADRFPDIKVLFTSGYTENAIVHHGVLDEGVHLLQKPFTADGLARRVREALDHD
ncbi:MAG: PAS domain S-box protein [Planctomycetota bacterium]